MAVEKRLGITGASGYVGRAVLDLSPSFGFHAVGFSRSAPPPMRRLGDSPDEADIPYWIDIAPIWTFSERADAMARLGARRIVSISSTSRFTKADSQDPAELAVAQKLADGEANLADWCDSRGVEWVVLRPTIIYGRGDRNLSEIASMIRRFGFFPLFGSGRGQRQPIHFEDLAQGCLQALTAAPAGRAYNVSGGEVLSYREMVERVFGAMDRRPVMPSIPLPLFAAALSVLRLAPRFRKWTPQMAERMNRDMAFDHSEAANDFGFAPGPFRLRPEDLA